MQTIRSILLTALMLALSPLANGAAVAINDSRIDGWAASFVPQFVPGPAGLTFFQQAHFATGVAEGDTFNVTNLGRGGFIVMTFENGIRNGPGDDFAVFENGFMEGQQIFGELAFVEVSSDGIHFLRFPTFATNSVPVDEFGTIDPNGVHGVAGTQPAGVGTGFDLEIFSGVELVDINDIRFVRVVDLVGDGRELDLTPAVVEVKQGGQVLFEVETGCPCPIYDPFSPALDGPNGFDLDAIAVLNAGSNYILDDVMSLSSSPDSPFALASVPLPGMVLPFAMLALMLTRCGKTVRTRKAS